MPLDAAEFIAELSIVDPPGSDPLNQGDDHIRTTKRAVQQSFPNVGSAVPQTGAQMAQMAIKNEFNTFTRTVTFDTGGAETAIAAVGKIELAAQATGSTARLEFQDVAKTVRWRLEKVQESIASDLRLQRFDASGVFVDAPLTVSTSGGNFRFNNRADFDSNVRLNLQSGETRGLQWQREDLAQQVFSLNFEDLEDALMLRRFVAGVNTDNPIKFPHGASEVDMTGAGRVFMRNDTMQFRAETEPPNTSRVGFGIRNGDNQVQWEFYRTNGPSFNLNMCQRRINGVFQDNPITIRNADGGIVMVTLPTVNPGVNGMLWKSGGFVAISSG